MSLKKLNPSSIAPPAGSYSHAMLIPAGSRVLHVSGQVGIGPDGQCATGAAKQSEIAWTNVMAILAEAGMNADDIVKVNSYVVTGTDFSEYAQVRSRFLGDAKPASTSLIVSALVKPEWLVEVEVVAARADEPPAR